jgi:hypothetical protein|nr:MAG TPA: Head Tail Connector Protein [Caudoviricetes sp.]
MKKKIVYYNFNDDDVYKLKRLLGLNTEDALDELALDESVRFSLDDACEIVRNYCNLDGVPEGLKNTVLRMAMDLYRHENIGSEGSSSGVVSSIKEGDTTVSYTNLHGEFKDTILKDYSKQLNKYRKISFR